MDYHVQYNQNNILELENKFSVNKNSLIEIVNLYSDRILGEELDYLLNLEGVQALEQALQTNFKNGLDL